jgi:acyl-CoA reductase-like NAD-dependent aldehyde dehydrogenase
VFADVTNDMTIVRHEIFDPVLVAVPFDDDAEPIAMANDSNFGLGSAIWTRDVAHARGLLKALLRPRGLQGLHQDA